MFVIILVHGHTSVIIIILIIMLWEWKERRKCGTQCIEEVSVCAGQWQNEALRWAGGRIRASVKWTFRFISGDKRQVFASVPSLPSLSFSLLSLPLTPHPCFLTHSRFFFSMSLILTSWYLVLLVLVLLQTLHSHFLTYDKTAKKSSFSAVEGTGIFPPVFRRT